MKADLPSQRPRPTIVKRGSVTVKIYRGKTRGYETFLLAYYEAGQRIRRTFNSLAEAKTEAEIVATRLDQADSLALQLTGTDRQQYLLATAELQKTGVPLHLAIKEFVAAKALLARDRFWTPPGFTGRTPTPTGHAGPWKPPSKSA